MLPETFPGRAKLLEPLLRVVRFALEHNQRARQFVGHFRAAALQLFLTTAQLLEFALLFFNQLLLAFELEQLLLGFLHLRVEMLGRERFFLAQVQHLFDRSNFFWHDKS